MDKLLAIKRTLMQTKNQNIASNLIRCGSSSLNKRGYYIICNLIEYNQMQNPYHYFLLIFSPQEMKELINLKR